LVVEEKISCREAAQRLSLAPSTLAYWVKAYKSGKLGEIGKAQKALTEVEVELARTKKELAEVKEGDRVAVNAITPCYKCENCLRGYTS
jgi:transposase-like protein